METIPHSRQSTLCTTSSFEVKIAESLHEIETALRIRYEVFNLELKGGLQSSYDSGFDSDVYDTFCDHLIVKERSTGRIAGTYRLLPQWKAGKNKEISSIAYHRVKTGFQTFRE